MAFDPVARFDSDDTSWLVDDDSAVEGQFVERKEWADEKEIARQLSAFANSKLPGGLLVLGVKSAGALLGLVQDCFAALRSRLRRDPLPARDWTERVLAVATQWSDIADLARATAQDITE